MAEFEKKYFGGDGGLDADSADFAVAPNDWVNSENIRTNSTDAGVVGSVEQIGSTILRSAVQPSVNFITLHKVEDTQHNRLLRFQYSIYGPWHKIMCYYLDTQTEYTVLRNDQTVSNEGLIFDKDSPIHSARIENGILYWTDNSAEPKRINIDAGIKLNHPAFVTDQEAYTLPVDYTVVTIIRQPPQLPLVVEKLEDVAYDNNFIANESMLFYYRYYYRDGEISTISTNSIGVTRNFEGELFNYIQITVSESEFIEQGVQRIDLIVQYGNGGQMFVVKSWDKNILIEAQQIQDHNDGTQQLTHDFYNDVRGIAIGDFTNNYPADRVPLKAESLEIARNRLFLGRPLLGYDTPGITSLQAAVVTVEEGGVLLGTWYHLQIDVYENGFREDPTGTFDEWVMRVDGHDPLFYYFDEAIYPAVPPDPINLAAAEASGNAIGDIADYIVGDPSIPRQLNMEASAYTSAIGDATGSVSDGQRFFKSNGTYQIGIVFADRYRRKCGVLTNSGIVVKTPLRSYDQTVYNQGISWTLSNANAINEIPDWAYFYYIVRGKNQTALSFMQARANDVTYALKDAAGVITYTDTYALTNYALAVDISALSSFAIGYVFTEGDLLIYYGSPSATPQTLRILGQEGKYVLCTLINLGNTATAAGLFEIFTPVQKQIYENFYDIGECYEVLDPGTGSRQYSITSNVLNGDISILQRSQTGPVTYFVEAMSANDKFWQDWFTDIGWTNIITPIGQVRLNNSGVFSNTYIEGTRTNGLSTFLPLSQFDIPLECGPLRKLLLTSKVNNEMGAVMIAICEKEWVSIYLGEVQQYGSAAATTITVSNQVIGTLNVLKGNYGTINPESAIEFRGMIFCYDAINGKIIQYASNGLFAISSYKMTRFWKLFSDQFLSMTKAEIETLGSRPFVYMAVDPHNMELLVTIPKLLGNPPKGYLPDYPGTIYPFDIWDGQAKTLVFKLNIEPNKWMGAYRLTPESMLSMQNKIFYSKNGLLYEGNSQQSFCEFFGVQYTPKIMFIANQDKAIPKTYKGVSINGRVPLFVYLRSESPYVQASDLVDYSFETLEGNQYSPILRNKLIPTATGFLTTGLLTAEGMRTPALRIMIEWGVSRETLPLINFISIGYQISLGHSNFKS